MRYGAVSGVSGIMCQAATATRTEGNPSTRKSRRHGAIGPYSAKLMISQASEDAKVVASGAATHSQCLEAEGVVESDEPDMKIAVRNASSSLLKKKDK